MNSFYLPFSIGEKKYCYDSITNNIMRIDDVLYDVLHEFDYQNDDSIFSKFSSEYSSEKLSNAITLIRDKNKEEGFFQKEGYLDFHFPFSKEDYLLILSHLQNDMILCLTENCNFRCKYCVYGGTYKYERPHSNKRMSIDVAKSALDFLIKNSQYILRKTNMELVLSFYGGEPLLEFDMICRIIEYINKEYRSISNRFKYSLTTNGYLLDERKIKKLIEHNFSLFISFDGPAELHDRYRLDQCGEKTHALVARNIDMIKTLNSNYFKNKVGFVTVIAPEYRYLQVLDYFATNYSMVSSQIFTNVSDRDTTFFESFDMIQENAIRNEALDNLEQRFVDSAEKGNPDKILARIFAKGITDIHFRSPFKLKKKAFPPGLCLPGVQRLFIDVDGKFHICEKLNHSLSIGDLEKGFKIDKIFSLFEQYLAVLDECKRCWAIRFCQDCYLNAVEGNCFKKQRKYKECDSLKSAIKNQIVHYVTLLDKNPKFFKEADQRISRDIFKLSYRFLDERKKGAYSVNATSIPKECK